VKGSPVDSTPDQTATAPTTGDIDTTNYGLVAPFGPATVVIQRYLTYLSHRQALSHAAWLVVCAGDAEGKEFMRYLEAIRNT
jgi:hypothetical protein